MNLNITQKDLDRFQLSSKDLTHFSQPDEMKRLLLEREMYKRLLLHQQPEPKIFYKTSYIFKNYKNYFY